jgi:hypothetical protein
MDYPQVRLQSAGDAVSIVFGRMMRVKKKVQVMHAHVIDAGIAGG